MEQRRNLCKFDDESKMNAAMYKCTLHMLAVILLLTLFISESVAQSHTLTQLTFSDTTHDGYPYWSPDGSQIIYSSGTTSHCITMKIPSHGGTPQPITEVFAQHARWSPAGDLIAFDGDLGTTIQIIPSSGGTPVRIDPDSIVIQMSGMPCWSPDGSQVVFKSGFTNYIYHISQGTLSELPGPEGKNTILFDWSPDGRWIMADARDTSDQSQSDIWIIPLEGTPHQITFLPGRQVKPSLSPDGSMFVFASDHGGNADLWVMSTRGGVPIQLTFYEGDEENPGFDIEPSWSPGGQSVAFSSTRNDRWAIWRMDLDLETLKEMLVETVSYSITFPIIDTGTIPLFPFLMERAPATEPASSVKLMPSPAISWDNRELVLAITEDNHYSWFDATVENRDTLDYTIRKQGKGNQLLTDRDDFPTLASTGLHSVEEINNTRSITGRSISRITVDGRPGGSSGAGFMAKNETILSVIHSDNRIVAKLGLKHPDLARPLLHLWNITNIRERYNEQTSAGNRIHLKGLMYGGRTLGIKVTGSRGWQESIFNDEILGNYHLEVWRELDPEEHEFLKRHYAALSPKAIEILIKKLSTIHTGEMVPYYINRYGFYEGHTDFRADPLAIAFIFGLRSIGEVHHASGGDLYTYLTTHFTDNP